MFLCLPEGPLLQIAALCGPCALARLRRAAARLSVWRCLEVRVALWAGYAKNLSKFPDDKEFALPATELLVNSLCIRLGTLMSTSANDAVAAEQLRRKFDAALVTAVCKGFAPIVQLLLALTASPDGLTKHGVKPPLLAAVESGKNDIVDALLQASANPNCMDVRHECDEVMVQQRPLEVACRLGSLALLQALIRSRADVNLVCRTEIDGQTTETTPLLVACDRAKPDLFVALVRAGADPDIECEDPLTETGSRSVRATLSWMMGAGDARQFRSHGARSAVCSDQLHRMFDAFD